MRRISVPLVGAIAVLIAASAYAATDTGVVVSINTNIHALTLSDDEVFFTPPSIDLGRFPIGYTVTVTYTKEDSSNKATAVDILPSPSRRQQIGHGRKSSDHVAHRQSRRLRSTVYRSRLTIEASASLARRFSPPRKSRVGSVGSAPSTARPGHRSQLIARKLHAQVSLCISRRLTAPRVVRSLSYVSFCSLFRLAEFCESGFHCEATRPQANYAND